MFLPPGNKVSDSPLTIIDYMCSLEYCDYFDRRRLLERGDFIRVCYDGIY